MKKTGARVATAMAEPMTGCYGGIDIGALYIDMLCDKFKNRGIKTGLSAERTAQIKRDAKFLGIELESVSAKDEKYRTMKIDGKAYMSSDDFAAYYKDLRGYKMPHFYSRAEMEYEEAAAGKNVQESGKPPKKALWLAIKKRTEKAARAFGKEYVVDEFHRHFSEELPAGRKKRIPKGVISTMEVVTMSLLLVVCSSVMVSRASSDVSRLEYQIDLLEESKNDLEGKLVEKNNMLDIRKIAIEEYNMIASGFATSKFLDVTEDEEIELFYTTDGDESFWKTILKAIGFIPD